MKNIYISNNLIGNYSQLHSHMDSFEKQTVNEEKYENTSQSHNDDTSEIFERAISFKNMEYYLNLYKLPH